ncbi:MAG: helix-turn-helix transcriptional regulator, partial [Candidatus Enteromonas sp.]|nr:helix-turn-helix transcriptional regulator [Candidatus Enteromonas sp.]
MENLSEITGKNLSTLRKARGMTQQQLADVLHYSDKSISKWELGYACPSVD